MQVQLSAMLLQAAPGNGYFSVVMMVGMVVVMYFFMIRPQAKRAKEQKKFSDSMENGEQVVTTAGIHGRVNRVNEDGTLQLEIARNTYITIERSAISMEMTTAHRKKTGSIASTAVSAS